MAQPAHAGLRADRGHAHLDPRVAEGALLRLAGAVVEVDLLVRAAGDAHPPAAAAVLVDEHDAVLGPLVHRPGRAGGDAGRVEAVLADARQVEHEGPLELEPHLVRHLAQHGVAGRELGRAGEIVVPVRAPGDLGFLAGDERARPGDRDVVLGGRGEQPVVVVRPGLVVVLDGRHERVGEDGEQPVQPPAGAQPQPPAPGELPAALPPPLVLVGARVPLAGPGLDVVEPDVLGARPVGPRLLAGDRAGVAADALVEVHHHGELGHDLHQYATSWARRRITVISSRWLPVGPR